MDEPIDGLYFNWLCAKVLSVDIPIYFDLMRILYCTEFIWSISGDKNREEDGIELRLDFLRESFLSKDEEWFDSPCSVLEVFIAFAKRASFQTDIPPHDWFWQFLTNLNLDKYRRVTRSDEDVIDKILYVFLNRQYSRNGDGGLFPMRQSVHDQREVEIWYQFCEYLDDKGLI